MTRNQKREATAVREAKRKEKREAILIGGAFDGQRLKVNRYQPVVRRMGNVYSLERKPNESFREAGFGYYWQYWDAGLVVFVHENYQTLKQHEKTAHILEALKKIIRDE